MSGSVAEPGVITDPDRPRHDAAYVGELFGVPTRRVYDWAASGQIGCYRLGHRTLRFSDRQLAEFARARKVA